MIAHPQNRSLKVEKNFGEKTLKDRYLARTAKNEVPTGKAARGVGIINITIPASMEVVLRKGPLQPFWDNTTCICHDGKERRKELWLAG